MAKFSLMKIYKRFDLFGQNVQFNVDGKQTVTSCMGATLSFVVVFLTIAYAWTRFNVLLKFGDTTFQETLDYRGSAIKSEVYAQSDTNFHLAFGLQSLFGWGIGEYGYVQFDVFLDRDEESGGTIELGFHQCTEKDRGYFYETANEGEYEELEREFFFLYCLDDPSLVDIKASIDAGSYSQLSIVLSRCKDQEHCEAKD